MPTYEYRCIECGHEFERFQMMKEGALRKKSSVSSCSTPLTRKRGVLVSR